jgi:hypothetical protein
MSKGHRWLRPARIAGVAVFLSALLSGCGYDVELNGAVFDYLGVSSNSQTKKGEPRVAARSGLVLPPDLEKLPEPGSGAVAAQGQEAWPVDADQKRVADAANLDKKHEEFCRDALWRAKARGATDEIIPGPKGPCNPSIFRSLTGKEIPTGTGSAATPTPR